MDMNRPIFEVREIVPGGFGRTYRIFADGRIEGFDGPHFVSNGIAPLLHLAQGLAKKALDGGLISAEEAASLLG